eukprot:TRINITY_DN27217_c0_g8_i1.p1 TRINITY_DN27217_c0_g8~~TRINITY_DN27217_c0_g8_i1.p1  ORF type:complete len:269 (-),score=50.00 TRINITY_DN27217_c0_g8_i1:236-1042(-)
MSLLNMQSMEWTPAARLVAFIAGMLTLSSSMLIFSCLRSCFYKVEPHTQKLLKNSRIYEMVHGCHMLLWSFSMVAGLLSGAQVTCILLLPSMLVWTCFHYSGGGKLHAVLNFALTAALAYFGFVPFPKLPPLEWTPAAIWMTFLAFSTVLAALPQLMGGETMDAQYDQRPYWKKQFCDEDLMGSSENAESCRRARELAWAAHLLGASCCMAAAIISGGAQDLCLLLALPFALNGYGHWLRREEHKDEKMGGPFCWILAIVTLVFGIWR